MKVFIYDKTPMKVYDGISIIYKMEGSKEI